MLGVEICLRAHGCGLAFQRFQRGSTGFLPKVAVMSVFGQRYADLSLHFIACGFQFLGFFLRRISVELKFLQECLDSALRHGVGFLGLSCAWSGAGLDDPCGCLPTS